MHQTLLPENNPNITSKPVLHPANYLQTPSAPSVVSDIQLLVIPSKVYRLPIALSADYVVFDFR